MLTQRVEMGCVGIVQFLRKWHTCVISDRVQPPLSYMYEDANEAPLLTSFIIMMYMFMPFFYRAQVYHSVTLVTSPFLQFKVKPLKWLLRYNTY